MLEDVNTRGRVPWLEDTRVNVKVICLCSLQSNAVQPADTTPGVPCISCLSL